MQAFFSSEGSFALQFLVIFLVILVLLLGASLLFMRLSGRRLSLAANAGQRGRQPRLGIVDIYELDRQRQLILLRRDNVEHLLLVGGPNDVVIERHIQRGAGTRYAPEAAARSEAGMEAVEAGALEPPRTDPFLDSPAPPTFTMPEVVPSVATAAPSAIDRTPPLDPGLFEPEVSPAEARPRPASPVSRLTRRTPLPVVGSRPETASERAARPESALPDAVYAPAATSPIAAPSATAPAVESPPVIASREPRVVDPAVLSDMARQLQVALKRPSSAVTLPPGLLAETPPAPLSAAPLPAKPLEPEALLRPDPVAAAMAAPQPPAPIVPPAAPKPQEAPAAASVSPPQTTQSAPPIQTAPPPVPEAPKPDLSKPDLSKSEPSKPDAAEGGSSGPNPFSVEEIEAEFARLLGRPLDTKG